MVKYLINAFIFLVAMVFSLMAIANDPMRPDYYAVSASDSKQLDTGMAYKLSLILINGNVKKAVINGEMKSEGDVIGSSKIARINEDNVVLMKEGHRQILYLLKIHGR